MTNAAIIILFLITIILLIVCLIVFIRFGHRALDLIKKQNLENHSEVIEQKNSSAFCFDHHEELAHGRCAISGEFYCERCLSRQEEVTVAKKYLDEYLDYEWVELVILSNEENQGSISQINDLKKKIWEEQKQPIIVQGHFKINVQTDKIELFTVVLSRLEDQDRIKQQLSRIESFSWN
jgi:hypothetical protein